MRKYILSLAAVFSLLQAQAQIELGTHFMPNIAQNNLTNPAAFNDYKINVTLPSVQFGFFNSAFKPSTVLEKTGNTLSLDMDKLVGLIGEDGMNLQANVNVETFSFAFQTEKFQISINHGARVMMNHHLPQELLQFGWGGNAQFVDETINIGPMLNMLTYHEIGLGFGYKVTEQLTLGTRLKYLQGVATYGTTSNMAKIYTDPTYYQLTASTNYMINTGGLPEGDFNDGDIFPLDDFEPELFGGNKGFAFDFGASFDLTEKLNIQASVLNIGKIKWTENVNNYYSMGTNSFAGMDFETLSDEGELTAEEVLDTLAASFEFETYQESFNTRLPTSFYLSGTYEVMPKLSVGALFYAQGFQSELTTAFALNVRKEFGSIFSLGAQYAAVKGGVHNFGLNGALQLGPVQIFATTDNLAPIFNPLKGQNINFRVGLNLAFGKIEKEEKEITIDNNTEKHILSN